MTDSSRPISIRRQADAVDVLASGLKFNLARRAKRVHVIPPADELSAIRVLELEAAVATLRRVEKHEASIRACMEGRSNAHVA